MAAAGKTTRVENVRVSSNPEYTRVVFDLDSPVKHSLFTLSGPERVVIDLKNAQLLKAPPSQLAQKSKLLDNIRSAPRNTNDLRFVLDLTHRVRPKSFMLSRKERHSQHRLVIDLYNARAGQVPRAIKKNEVKKLRDVVIAVDAGHGGKDPGALGHGGLLEKEVTLKIARRLARHIDATRGMQAVLIRDSDEYIPLRKRIIKARARKSDLFVSIHADAFNSRHASGSSVYALSINGASSEAAKWLADRENASDLMGGVSLDDKDDLIASVLLDLSQTATIQSSLEVGDHILGQLGKINKLHKHEVQQAGFLVLKSPDIPSVLIETAFITNPGEASKLRNHRHQERVARAIVQGIQHYFSEKAPPGTWLAEHGRGEKIALK